MQAQSLLSADEASELGDILRTRLDELTLRVAQIEADLRAPVDDDLEEQAIDREDDEPAEVIERAALDEIAAIEAALRRIDRGTYGRCLSCGDPIGLQRLLLVPAATRCISCARGFVDN
jgi:RNA polymerase-binding transcription factor DksA